MSPGLDVRLPLDAEPLFPEDCVGCGRPRARHWIRLEAEYMDPERPPGREPAQAWRDEKEIRVAAPACARCVRAGRRRGMGPVVACVVLTTAFVVGSLYFTHTRFGFPVPRDRYWDNAFATFVWLLVIMVVGAVVTFVSLLVSAALFPPVLDISVVGGLLEYRFRNRESAREFARLNSAEVREPGGATPERPRRRRGSRRPRQRRQRRTEG